MTDAPYRSGHWTSHDGLNLHYRDYPGDEGRPPILCLHGLTRNARDFDALACSLMGQWRVIVPEMRGRGKSDYAAASADYAVPTYVQDILALRQELGIDRYVAVGTSMGGLMTMAQAREDASPIVGALLNDIGPVIEAEGLTRIRGYVGQGRGYPTWMHAARSLQDVHGASHPGFTLEDWLAMAKRTMILSNSGRITLDYDVRIAEPILASDANAAPPDLWPGYDALADKPLLLMRGVSSDLLSPETFAEMQRRSPSASAVTVPDTGHAPTLDEPVVREAIGEWLGRIAAR